MNKTGDALPAGRISVFLIWLLFFGIPLIVTLKIYTSQSWLPENIITIDKVDRLYQDVPYPPPGHASWLQGRLPDDWRRAGPGSRNAWYRFSLDLNLPPNRLWAIFLPSIDMNVAVYLNGHLLGDGGRFAPPMARNWNTPQYFVIPNGMLNSGENRFEIRIAALSEETGYLGEIHLAPDEVLRPAYETRYFIKVALPRLIAGSMLVMSLFMGILWYLRRSEPVYGWFSIVLLVWAVHNANLFVTNIPVSNHLWDWFWFVTMAWFVIVVTVFVHRFLDRQRPRLERYMMLTGLAGSVLLLMLPDSLLYGAGYGMVDNLSLLLGIYPASLLMYEYRKQRDAGTYLLLLSGLLLIVFGVHDSLMLNGFISRENGLMMHYSAPLPLLVFSWILLTRFARALETAERANVELAMRVEEKHRELEANYKRLRQMERDKVLVMERERIMRDMHDGMGGHLISTLSMVEVSDTSREDILDALHDALDDLRIMIDSLDPVEEDLTTVLAMYRSRIQPRLERSHIAMRWHVTDIPRIPGLGPEKVVQVLRILQEAISNVIKHAGADEISILTRELRYRGVQGVAVEIHDNGTGMTGTGVNGRGLSNMRRRAEQIGAVFDLDSDKAGTRVSLWFPLGDDPD